MFLYAGGATEYDVALGLVYGRALLAQVYNIWEARSGSTSLEFIFIIYHIYCVAACFCICIQNTYKDIQLLAICLLICLSEYICKCMLCARNGAILYIVMYVSYFHEICIKLLGQTFYMGRNTECILCGSRSFSILYEFTLSKFLQRLVIVKKIKLDWITPQHHI